MPLFLTALSRLPSGSPSAGCLNQAWRPPFCGVITDRNCRDVEVMIFEELVQPLHTIRPPCRSPSNTTSPALARSMPGALSGHRFHHPLIVSGLVVDCVRHFSRGTLSILAF